MSHRCSCTILLMGEVVCHVCCCSKNNRLTRNFTRELKQQSLILLLPDHWHVQCNILLWRYNLKFCQFTINYAEILSRTIADYYSLTSCALWSRRSACNVGIFGALDQFWPILLFLTLPVSRRTVTCNQTQVTQYIIALTTKQWLLQLLQMCSNIISVCSLIDVCLYSCSLVHLTFVVVICCCVRPDVVSQCWAWSTCYQSDRGLC